MKYASCRGLSHSVKRAYGIAEKCFDKVNAVVKSTGIGGSASSWLCENFHIISAEKTGITKALADTERLPADGKIPRFYRFISDYTESTKELSKEKLKELVLIYDKALSASFFELSAYGVFIRAALMIKLGNLCHKMLEEKDAAVLCSAREYASVIEYCVTGFRLVADTDFEKLISECSSSEKLLCKDACGAYKYMTPETKQRYREAVTKLSAKQKKSESRIIAEALEKAKAGTNERTRHIGTYFFSEKKHTFGYLYFVFTVLFAALFTAAFYPLCGLFCLLILPAAYELGKQIADLLGAKLCVPEPLFSMKLKDIPDKMRTLTVKTALLTGSDAAYFDELEDFYLANRDKNAFFGILADLVEGSDAVCAGDGDILEYAKGRIDALNLKYGGGFCLFSRERTYSSSETKYMGWERKRGAVVELAELLSQGKSTLELHGDANCAENIKYVITLDADTLISVGDVKRLVGYMAHPLNAPIIDSEKRIVTQGYGIMQPRMQTALIGSDRTAFSLMQANAAGTEVYKSASYDSYQELFGEGVFCGKGIFDVGAFEEVIKDAFPEKIVLSHDVLEGSRLRAALLCDMTLYDGVPSTPASYFKRAHRWIRGDVQALLFVGKYVKNASGKKVKNPINALSKYKIIDSVRRDLLPVFSVIAVTVAAFLSSQSAAALAAGAFSYLLLPLLYGFAGIVFSPRVSLLSRKFYTNAAVGIYRAAEQTVFGLCSIFYSAQNAADAALRALYRAKISHRKTLEWTTAAQAEHGANTLYNCILTGLPSAAAGTVLVLISSSFFVKSAAALWVLYPVFCYILGRPTKKKKIKLSQTERKKLLKWASDMWDFYARYVTAQTNFLPPDNISFENEEKLAMRTSPTNIGFYLASVLCARDLELIDTKTMFKCVENTLCTVEKLKKHNGHLYNWYDIKSLAVIGGEYVSSVDSGNFCALLATVREGILEYSPEHDGIPSLAAKADKILSAADFSEFYNEERKLLSLGYSGITKTPDSNCYDLLMSEARLTSYYAVAKRDVPPEHWYALSRRLVKSGAHIGLASWTGTAFEYFMPALLLPTYGNSATDEALRHCVSMQKRKSADGMWGTSESGYYSFDSDANYRYKAFGVGALALRCDMDSELVLSPYSAFLCALCEPQNAIRDLTRMKERGMYGRFGFYEAADFTPKRVGSGVGIVKSYMAHHVGMSICACAELLMDGILCRRFMHNPEMHSASLLLAEQIPADAIVTENRFKTDILPKKAAFARHDTVKSAPCGGERCTAAISNGYSKIIADTNGVIGLYEADRSINIADYGGYAVPRSLRLMWTMGGRARGLSFGENTVLEYGAGFIRYKLSEERFSVTLTLSVSAQSRAYLAYFEYEGEHIPERVSLYFEPLLSTLSEYEAHPAYSGLFMKSELCDGTLVFSRKLRGKGKGSRYLAIKPSAAGEYSVCTEKSELLPSPYTNADILAASQMEYNHENSNLINPVCMFSVTPKKKSEKKFFAGFAIASSDSRDEAVYSASEHATKLSAYGVSPYITELSAASENAYAISGLKSADELLCKRILNALTVGEKYESSASREVLWKYGISGDFPVVICEYDRSDEETALSYIRAHRYFFVNGIRFDLVFLCRDGDGYRRENYRAVLSAADSAGSSELFSIKGGIFVIDSEKAASELEEIKACSALCPDSRICEGKLEQSYISPVPPVADICSEEVIKEVWGGYFVKDGFAADKTKKHIPWAHIIASPCFGTVVTDSSLGYTYLFNSQLGLIDKKDSDLMRSSHGESLILETHGKRFDLAACGSRVYYGVHGAKYAGTVAGMSYTLTVGVAEKDFVKSVGISLHGAPEDARLVFLLSPLMGEKSGGVSVHTDDGIAVFRKSGGFLAKYSGFLRFRGAELSEENGIITAALPVSGDVNATAYIGAFASKAQLSRLLTITDGRLFDAGTDKLMPHEEIRSEYSGVNALCDFWLPYQTVVSRLFARTGYYQASGAYGFRDQLQDAVNVADFAPKLLYRQIVRCAYHQFKSGDVLHWWHRTDKGIFGARTLCSDDRLWLPYAVCEYIKNTGDASVLDVKVPYIEAPELEDGESERCVYARRSDISESIYSHCMRALSLSVRTGSHGLPLIGSCDWNDGMNAVGADGNGESVWLAFFTKLVCDKFVPICRARKKPEDADFLLRLSSRLCLAAKKAFEYGQYIRAYFGDGTPVGSKLNAECKTDILVQAFAILSGAESGERAQRITDTIESLADKELGIIKLLSPPFTENGDYAGYINDYPPGVRENGGQYTHAAMWAILALKKGGRDKEAKELFLSVCPAERCASEAYARKYQIEPYVAAGDVFSCGKLAQRGGWSFYTGAAGWMLTAAKKIFSKRLTNEKSEGIIDYGNKGACDGRLRGRISPTLPDTDNTGVGTLLTEKQYQ